MYNEKKIVAFRVGFTVTGKELTVTGKVGFTVTEKLVLQSQEN